MTPRLTLGPAIAAILFAPAVAQAADTELVKKLAPEIAKRCDAATGTISAQGLRQAIGESKVAPLTHSFEWGSDAPRAIARAAFSNASGDNVDALNLLQRLMETWVDPTHPSSNLYLPISDGGISVTYGSSRTAPPGEAEAILVAILAGDDSRYRFRCIPAPAAPAVAEEQKDKGWRPKFALARTPKELLLKDITKKKFAEFSYTDDREADEQSYSIYATAGLIGPLVSGADRGRAAGGPGVYFALWPVVLVQYEREGTKTNEDKVNNLSAGFQLGGFFQPRGRMTLTHYYSLTGRFITDDEFDSKAFALAATFTPEIPIIGNDIAYDIIPNRLRFRWLATLAADHQSVSDPGEKAELMDKPNFTRIGGDLDGELRFLLSGESVLSFLASYQLREALSGSVGDARMLTLRLAFEPVQNMSAGVAYERGRNLDSLEFGKKWRVSAGLRW